MPAVNTPAKRSYKKRGERHEGQSTEWYEREVPGIVSGLETSNRLSNRTAKVARRLIQQGHHRTALHLVMDEVNDS
ncbi:hypothetical protein C499_12335 [Halogeometricum borinquense DSM 11551]|uniref:Uncharacterized protein n=1 Tax=Halogeometricum borinquense (strain ATCC 700274 / DSM 11551 / JCM 10706 / KCTC 4070 / PR3) TaxID=469382 RepID=E4NWD7_HALBP|nr:hypothetical protein Hbor_36510 [Halogeometricum borinquense DSM 11551]ELY26246.1 hypothetical protein C499_12335 [Halogeometricum borinquense DSM 11551]